MFIFTRIKQIVMIGLVFLFITQFAVAQNKSKTNSVPKKEVRARVFFISPKDRATITKKVKVKFGVEGMQVKKAGTMEPLTGHHHLIIDGQSFKKGDIIPKDAKNLHFGDGQTETEIELSPGSHTLTLQFADGAHKSFGEEMSATIHVQVK